MQSSLASQRSDPGEAAANCTPSAPSAPRFGIRGWCVDVLYPRHESWGLTSRLKTHLAQKLQDSRLTLHGSSKTQDSLFWRSGNSRLQSKYQKLRRALSRADRTVKSRKVQNIGHRWHKIEYCLAECVCKTTTHARLPTFEFTHHCARSRSCCAPLMIARITLPVTARCSRLLTA